MEFELIERIRQRVPHRDDVLLGIGDDAAIVQVPPGMQLLVSTDTLNAGVHFPPCTSPPDIGWKALAVNLSDLAAMGAQPRWCTLSLSMPDSDPAWLDGFLDGFLELAGEYRVALIGGDTTRGPLSIGVTAMGIAAPGQVLRRDAAQFGDDVWVSGTLGDAAGALRLQQPDEAMRSADAEIFKLLRPRLDRPTPRIGLGLALAGVAHACIDVSDGLLADLGHICDASAVAARVKMAALPASEALKAAFDADARAVLQAAGGDDYELCFTAPRAAHGEIERIAQLAGTALTRIGQVTAGRGVSVTAADGQPWSPPSTGYVHFGD